MSHFNSGLTTARRNRTVHLLADYQESKYVSSSGMKATVYSLVCAGEEKEMRNESIERVGTDLCLLKSPSGLQVQQGEGW